MPEDIPFYRILEVIKGELKKRRMTYANLATELSMSESGVKKLLSSNDCTYSRLNEISDVIGISVNKIIEKAK